MAGIRSKHFWYSNLDFPSFSLKRISIFSKLKENLIESFCQEMICFLMLSFLSAIDCPANLYGHHQTGSAFIYISVCILLRNSNSESESIAFSSIRRLWGRLKRVISKVSYQKSAFFFNWKLSKAVPVFVKVSFFKSLEQQTDLQNQ